MKNYRLGIFYFTQDLRLQDNPALTLAQQSCQQLIYCYVLDRQALSRSRYGVPSIGQHRLQFLHESLTDLQQQLAQQGHQLLILNGEPLNALTDLISQTQADAIFRSHQAGVYEQRRWHQLQRRFPYLSFQQRYSNSLWQADTLPFAIDQLPATFSQFRKALEAQPDALVERPLHAAEFSHKGFNKALNSDRWPSDSVHPAPFIRGGERAAQQHLAHYFSSNAPSTYKETRNALQGFSASTKLSAWLACGCLSPQQVVNQVRQYEAKYGANQSTYWILFELLWREYFYWYLIRYQTQVFAFKGLAEQAPQTSFYPSRFKQWCQGTTQYPLVNALMKQLNATGYMSNRGRQIVASCLVNELAHDWRYGAAYFEQQLIDYDVGSNWGNWQYIAGVGADPRGGRHFNLEKQQRQFDPDEAFVSRWRGRDKLMGDATDAADWPTGTDD